MIATPPRKSDDSTTDRWGAAVLAGCSFTFIVTMTLYMTAFGRPRPALAGGEITIADRAAHVLEKWPLISTVWIVEALAWGLLAVAGFALQHRRSASPAWLPSRAAWLAVGVGAVIQSVMYAFTLGAYPAAAAEAAATPFLFGALREAAFILFYLGNLFLFLGLGSIFLGEARSTGIIPRWIALSGAAACLAVSVLLVGLLAGFGQMMIVAPGALIGYLATFYLGLTIWRSAGTSPSDSNVARD